MWRDLAQWYIDNNLPIKAMEMVTRLRENGSDNPELLVFQDEPSLHKACPKRRSTCWSRRRPRCPKIRGHYALGIVLADLGEADTAITTFERALEIEDHIPTQNNLGFLLLAVGRCAEARDQLEAVIREDAATARYRNNLASSLVCTGEPQRALKLFRSMHDEASARYNMGLAYERLDKFPSATLQYQHALDVDPDHEGALEALARLEPMQLTPDAPSQEVE